MNGLVICRSAAEPLQPGARAGYLCQFCEESLQASPAGQRQIADEQMTPCCNDCALTILSAMRATGGGLPAVLVNESAHRGAPVESETGRALYALVRHAQLAQAAPLN